jgi:hypothetical protein
MKKTLLLLWGTCIWLVSFGQTSLPNGGFENWTSNNYSLPDKYSSSSNGEYASTFLKKGVSFNVTRTATAYNGSFAMELTTVKAGLDTIAGYMLTSAVNNSLSAWHGGIPYTEKPTSLRGYYKYNQASGDYGLVVVSFSKAGSNIGLYYTTLGGNTTSYTLFTLPITNLTQTPDSMNIGFVSSYGIMNDQSGVAGSTLDVDSLTFTGVTTQPDINGNFETWNTKTAYDLTDWYTDREDSVSLSTDSHIGNYAVKLKTFLGEQNNHAAARPGVIRTGYYANNCNGNCYPLGGYPYTRTTDILTFYYKYAPVNNDSAQVCLYFKKHNGSSGWNGCINLHAAASYQYAELPFTVGFTPDSVIVQIQSSYYADTLTSFVGSTLYIDQMQFKSDPLSTGLFTATKDQIAITVYPNPVNDTFSVDGFDGTADITVSDSNGRVLFTKQITAGEAVSAQALPPGVYILHLTNKEGVSERKFVKK